MDWRFGCVVLLPLLLACGGKDGEVGDETSGATAGDTGQVATTGVAPTSSGSADSDASGTDAGSPDPSSTTTGGGEPLYCRQAVTEEQCASAMPSTASDPYGCFWTPIYTATVEGPDTCSFQPAGGSCDEFAYGDTACGEHSGRCGFDVFGEVLDDGTMTIARTQDRCTQDPVELPIALCATIGGDTGGSDTGSSSTGGGPPSDYELLCLCGCSPSWPRE